ncbi:adenylate/guanylate cyclase domain-containing protein [Rhodoferax sp.]|jgi:class 3 adenylate cyclase|uniref:adenylate/guanylate cyclase domain-containing protein n=1 Tax=Rhodoferax sp. TaxID=50421 RepID=UPI00272FDC05|nr:adenylate/guanylate cyclase domain-containing protein [Rhodoferax sp.]MDP2442391.1 adenylate/guanylate cyclase domain-containing protein [Rhodoferax sp.]MDP3190421.1 adenylate/guanylate cyclase domain-containing protein [Rhodoferax sp.]MDP3337078.1 adenylate/guanylate cyclase domain-containing protein [Rhodoferax sp.]MDZ4209255.1 adenylate/guanylate cyclase domain-containing protein [Rhodoferax sp.]
MAVHSTVVFADLFGSTGVFESLGNVKATEAVTQATNWVAEKITANGGKVVKLLGDGVLATFKKSSEAIAAVVDIQRSHQSRLATLPPQLYMPLRIGVVRGDVILVDDDCYGDAVNTASRLSELTGPHQIWVNDKAIENSPKLNDVHFRFLGPIAIRGRSEPCNVYQIEWQEDENSDYFTIQAPTNHATERADLDALGGQISLSFNEHHQAFQAFELPIHIGRFRQVDFIVNDPRVSRTHASIVWRNGSFMLVDESSYGSWVRFAGSGADLMLRRDECVLHGQGQIALGTSFSDPSAPIVSFEVR